MLNIRKFDYTDKDFDIQSAIDYGAKTLITDNEENNPMYQINLKMGFETKPAWLSCENNVTPESLEK